MSLGKIFKKVTKSKLGRAFAVVAAGAVVFFTAGAALGAIAGGSGLGGAVSAGAGGWGATVAKLGSDSILRQMLVGAVRSAGIGALTGGIVSQALGGKFAEGAAGGALVGGITGAASAGISGLGQQLTTAPTLPSGAPATSLGSDYDTMVTNAAAPTAGSTTPGGGAPAVGAVDPAHDAWRIGEANRQFGAPRGLGAAAGSFLKSEGGGPLIGHALGGLGQGLVLGAQADDELRAQREAEAARADRYEGNYNTGMRGLAAPGVTSSPRRSVNVGRYEFDPRQGRLVFKPAVV